MQQLTLANSSLGLKNSTFGSCALMSVGSICPQYIFAAIRQDDEKVADKIAAKVSARSLD